MPIAAYNVNFTNFRYMENFNLSDYLIPGIRIYSVIHQNMKTVLRIEKDSDFPIVIGEKKKGYHTMRFTLKGSVLKNGNDCLLFPCKDTLTWEGYVTPLLFESGDIVKVINPAGEIMILIYSHFCKEKQVHCCFHSLSPNGSIIYSQHNQVDKFSTVDGFFYAKKVYSKIYIGKLIKNNS